MKKRGFTLIELLAVIVILAVIALIATPAVLGIIEDSKKSAAEASARNIASAAKAYYMPNLMNDISTGDIDLSNSSFKYDGEQATKGYLTYDAKGNVTGKMYVSGYCIEITESNTTSTKMKESECDITSNIDKPSETEDNPILAEKTSDIILEEIVKGDSKINSYVHNIVRYSNTTVKNAIEKYSDDNSNVSLSEFLTLLNMDISNPIKTTSGTTIDISNYDGLTPPYDIGIKENNTISFSYSDEITLTFSNENIKDLEKENLLLIYINPSTGKVSFVEFSTYDSEWGTFTVTLPSTGVIILAGNSSE